jgi:hypothetical protein
MPERSASLPPLVAWLGYGGLVPFVGLLALQYGDPHHGGWLQNALLAYGACILSFVGALHWGFAMTLPELDARQRNHAFAWSTLPSLVAWLALLVDALAAGSLLILAFIAHYLRDRGLARRASLPGWYLPLRFRLTAVAVLSVAGSLGGLWFAH